MISRAIGNVNFFVFKEAKAIGRRLGLEFLVYLALDVMVECIVLPFGDKLFL
jgi:hypothetical protein